MTVSIRPIGGGRRMLFHRHFEGYSGGHGKVWDYFNHAISLGFDARIHFSPESRRDASNPWSEMPERWVDRWRPGDADALFLAGLDWQAVDEGIEDRIPVVNLVQSVRHADPALPLRRFLGRRATRICVGREVACALQQTGDVLGTLHVIPAGLRLPAIDETSRAGVVVDGIKRPELAIAVARRLEASGVEVELVLEHRSRDDYLQALARAEVAILLPLEREGFYLPGLEAMALGTPVVTLDAVGNREYLEPSFNASVPPPDADSLVAAVRGLLADPVSAASRVASGRSTARRFSLVSERQAFEDVLSDALMEDR
jgi:glycosyltransferase involved in cell wall biosynthesis